MKATRDQIIECYYNAPDHGSEQHVRKLCTMIQSYTGKAIDFDSMTWVCRIKYIMLFVKKAS